ncbi:putative cuticle protein CPR149 [Danaus plexippus plexippus]|uniref:Cuticle protein CPR149 n=1 Tax=Danaus plexippus plexippus TaxID=278856 RepID=A0A212ESP1_DANPL|nr:putative cuticle protein CPR149 [Danaus plexippus plexippus]
MYFFQVIVYSAFAALDGYSSQQDPDQFHIQTDEDDERYFLYQTHNGQYRKERRLKDGSVVGTTGWVGADGFLRLQDYIADDQGYRIYKSKTVYVGENRSIGESLKIAKTAPTDSGFHITPAPAPNPHRGTPLFTTTTKAPSIVSSTLNPQSIYPSEISITPSTPTYPSSTFIPKVEVSPNSIDTTSKFNPKPTVPPITAEEASPSPNPYDYDISNTNTLDGYYGSDSSPKGRFDLYNPNSYRHADDWTRRQRPGIYLGDGYTPQFSGYDGVAFRRNGFRYYLPKQYHEEETHNDNERAGSFGYIDPFGIRRVIYYNTAPGEGFQIRKNNRYVGHDATPYDPRPVK